MGDVWATRFAADLLWAIDATTREMTLFAAVALLIGGLDDLLIDLLFFVRRLRGRGGVDRFSTPLPSAAAGRLAIIVPAWDEAAVIGAMLRSALCRIDHPDYRIFVGCYPNDPDTINAVTAVAEQDERVRLVIGAMPGPTTKADCLNAVWRALLADDAETARPTLAVILHDAEDVIPRAGPALLDILIRDHAAAQLPVVPLIAPDARLISGHYADEFAEAHHKTLPIRVALGAAMPLAGVGCAIRTDALHRIAALHGAPFDADSLTEDYELGLRLDAMGLSACFARYRDPVDGSLIAVRAYFPARLHAAVVQKARWMTGIALAGWDRIGWGRTFDIGEHWMRMRDRRAPLAVLTIIVAYIALLCWGLGAAGHAIARTDSPAFDPWLTTLLIINTGLMTWRIAVRAAMTASVHGWREGLWAIPRVVVGNYIAILAARRAISRYRGTLRGEAVRWDKTSHVFPDDDAVRA